MRNISWQRVRTALFLTVSAIVFITLVGFTSNFMYFFNKVEAQEIGVQFRQGRIYEVVGPGVYSDFGVFVSLETISSQAVPYTSRDEEMITKDKQRIGLVVSGDIFRPTDKDTVRNLWAQYRGIYTNDDAAINRVNDITRQSMKVCVGDRTFDDNIIGTARDELRNCIDTELNKLADQLGLTIENVVIPEVIISPEVQVALDAIVQSRLLTEKAAQDQLKADAEADAEQARQEGEIRVTQSRLQEETRQQTMLAQLEQERLAAQLVVIEADRHNELARLETDRQVIESTKANELISAERNVAINEKLAEAAAAKAEADAAFETLLAGVYANNPAYVEWLVAQANASALNPTDKVIFVPEGTTPSLVVPGPGIVPTVDTTPTE